MKKILIIISFFSVTMLCHSSFIGQKQGQALIDSLLHELEIHKAEDTVTVNLLTDISFQYNDINPDKGIEYARQGINIAEKLKFKSGLAWCYVSQAVCYWSKSVNTKALESYFKALKIFEELGDKKGIATNLGNIGGVYHKLNDYPKALEYYQKALKSNEELGRKRAIATNLSNIGVIYQAQADYQRALENYLKAMKIYEEMGYKTGVASALGNIGEVYVHLKKYDKALEYNLKSLSINKELNNKNGLLYNLDYIGFLYYKLATDTLGNRNEQSPSISLFRKELYLKQALDYYLKARDVAENIQAASELVVIYNGITDAYKAANNWQKAYLYADSAYKLNDSIFSRQNQIIIAKLDARRENEVKEKELIIYRERDKFQKMVIWDAAFAGVLLFLFLFIVWRERGKSEKLLLNILPSVIAKRLKKKEYPIADYFEEASVIFIDIADFTKMSSGSPPQEIVTMLNQVFTEFDHLASKYGIEKIKTIGDCYMAAAGIPLQREDHAHSMAAFALEAMSVINNKKMSLDVKNMKPGTPNLLSALEFRCGINCGPVVAGVIGEKKFIYDLWGDTVNTASRMEENGIVGRIQVTDRFKNKLTIDNGQLTIKFEERGEMEIKGKGMMKTWFLVELCHESKNS